MWCYPEEGGQFSLPHASASYDCALWLHGLASLRSSHIEANGPLEPIPALSFNTYLTIFPCLRPLCAQPHHPDASESLCLFSFGAHLGLELLPRTFLLCTLFPSLITAPITPFAINLFTPSLIPITWNFSMCSYYCPWSPSLSSFSLVSWHCWFTNCQHLGAKNWFLILCPVTGPFLVQIWNLGLWGGIRMTYFFQYLIPDLLLIPFLYLFVYFCLSVNLI